MRDRLILSLYDLTGAWSEPYEAAGYRVRRVDVQRDGADVRLLEHPGEPVWGILAAPPCRVFCRPGARLWKEWGPDGLRDGLSMVDAALRLVAICSPEWWALENPPGRLHRYLGKPTYAFHPYHHGDPYTKHTYLWGSFRVPNRTVVSPEAYPDHLPPGRRDRTSRVSSSWRNQRAATPPGFAQAFFDANP